MALELSEGALLVRRHQSTVAGPKAPAGLESTWMPTMGKEPYLWLRLYGPDEAFFEQVLQDA